jgi:CBS domain-containing protein
MIFGTNIPILGTGTLNGIWLAFIGWFLVQAASQSYQQVIVEDMLEGVPITQLMRQPAPAIPPDLPISALVYDHIMQGDDRAFPVVEGDRLLGVVYIENLRELDRSTWDTTTVRQVMVPQNELEVVTPREDAMDAFQKLAQKGNAPDTGGTEWQADRHAPPQRYPALAAGAVGDDGELISNVTVILGGARRHEMTYSRNIGD